MSRDPIVEELHEIRRKIMEECGNDPRQYFARLKAAEANDRDRLVADALMRLPPGPEVIMLLDEPETEGRKQ